METTIYNDSFCPSTQRHKSISNSFTILPIFIENNLEQIPHNKIFISDYSENISITDCFYYIEIRLLWRKYQ